MSGQGTRLQGGSVPAGRTRLNLYSRPLLAVICDRWTALPIYFGGAGTGICAGAGASGGGAGSVTFTSAFSRISFFSASTF